MKQLFIFSLSALLLMIIAAGCDTETLHNMNVNPNSVNQMELNYFFTAAVG
jgi:hypothetical protein